MQFCYHLGMSGNDCFFDFNIKKKTNSCKFTGMMVSLHAKPFSQYAASCEVAHSMHNKNDQSS